MKISSKHSGGCHPQKKVCIINKNTTLMQYSLVKSSVIKYIYVWTENENWRLELKRFFNFHKTLVGPCNNYFNNFPTLLSLHKTILC